MRLTKDEGRWFNYEEGVRFKLLFQPKISNDILEFIDKACIDWEGVEAEDGQPLKCTRTNKIKLLQTEEGRLVAAWVGIKMQDMMSFLDMDQLKKKLMPGSDGNSTSPVQVGRDA